eukprot:7073117-Prymnesium_polylepis.1
MSELGVLGVLGVGMLDLRSPPTRSRSLPLLIALASTTSWLGTRRLLLQTSPTIPQGLLGDWKE